jgi:hypothetical protein
VLRICYLFQKKLSGLFISLGAKIQHLQSIGRGTDLETLRTADYITSSTCTSTFQTCSLSLSLMLPIFLAMSVHSQFLDNSIDPIERKNLLDLLQADIKAMRAITSKFSVPLYCNYISVIENQINEKSWATYNGGNVATINDQLDIFLNEFLNDESLNSQPITW